MWAIEINLKDSPHRVSLHYRGGLTAETAGKDVKDALATGTPVDLFEITDDYGRKFVARVGDIGSVMIANLATAMESMVENQLAVARANADIIFKADSDPKLKLLAARGQMPGIKLQ